MRSMLGFKGDGLPKFKDFPAASGGSGIMMEE
jgi:hypothetical protein